MKKIVSFSFLSIFTALASSLCCIMPIIAVLAGTSGIASGFSWLEFARPYFIAITVIILTFAWYQKIKPVKKMNCNCDNKKIKFTQSKVFLGIITAFSVIMLLFPYYSKNFYLPLQKNISLPDKSNIQKVEFMIGGMTCGGCENHIQNKIHSLQGTIAVEVSYEKGNAIIQFDKKQINIEEIAKNINSIGYKTEKHQILPL